LAFAKVYTGDLITETMLVKDMNDGESQAKDIASFISDVEPVHAYLAIPTRPPAVDEIRSPNEVTINRNYQIFSEYLDHIEYLIGYEGNGFAFTGNFEEDILSITAVHPMREDAVRKLLNRANSDWEVIEELIADGKLMEIEYNRKNFYLRKFMKR
jgi:wyosine [tRNA(Phe)-imidazoG37] synthetase (radical SAM superfamily)